jgi:dihydroflavonol-4-reductase
MSEKVLVTGVSGYVGSHCAVELIKEGYEVRGSIRSLKKKDEVAKGVARFVDTKDKLEFCELNLLSDDGWAEAMKGCDYVLHVASPFEIAQPKDEDEMIKPAVEGALRALKFAKKAGVKKVVVTSSTVAMAGDKKVQTLTQDSWTDPAKDKVSAYMKSKAMAERAVWDFYKAQTGEDKLEITVINPGPIYGPTVTGNVAGASMSFFKQIIAGEVPMLPQCSYPMSDVRDIALLHVRALKSKASNGQRFIATTSDSYEFVDIAKVLKEAGYDKVHPKVAPNWLLRLLSLFSSEMKGMRPFIGAHIKADTEATKKAFNWEAIDFKKTVLDTAKSINSK